VPRYDYECATCKKMWEGFHTIEERDEEVCTCGKKATRYRVSKDTNTDIFQPMMYEDICNTPIWVTSKSQLREECKKHDVIAVRLL